MEVKSLTIERRPTYDAEYPGLLVGLVKMQGATGSQEIRLSNAALSRVFKVIADEVAQTARGNADMVPRAVGDAVAEYALLENSKVEVLS